MKSKFKVGDVVICRWAWNTTQYPYYVVEIIKFIGLNHKHQKSDKNVYTCRFLKSSLCPHVRDGIMNIYEEEIIGLKDDPKTMSKMVIDTL